MTFDWAGDLKDLAILVGFASGYAVMLWRQKVAEATIKEHAEVLNEYNEVKGAADQIHEDHARRIGRLEDRVFNGERR